MRPTETGPSPFARSKILALCGALAILGACSGDEAKPAPSPGLPRATLAGLFGKDPAAPAADRPSTAALVALGDRLYAEKRLSKNHNLSCASCHDLDNAGQDGLPTSPGSTGEVGARNTPTSLNAFRQFRQFWDGRAVSVEEQAAGPMLNPIEHGLAGEAELVAILQGIDGMPEAFAAAFPGEEQPITLANFGRAVGAFERTLMTRSRWDDYLDGDEAALNAEEKRGLQTFFDVGCATCHMFRTVGGGMYQKLGLIRGYETEDLGRFAVTGNDAERFVFKVPSLLNVEKTAPYFHDGSIPTLEEAVRKMGFHQLGLELTNEQIASIVAFLQTLSGELPSR